MKNKILILIAMVSAWMPGCGGAPTQEFEIAMSAPDCNNLMIRLYREADEGLVAVDSQKVEMGKARLRGSAPRPELMYIYVETADDYLPIFVENGYISVDLNLGKPAKSVISGSESNKIFTDFMQSYSVYNDKAAGYNRMARNASINNDSLMMQDLDSAHFSIRNEITEFQRTFVHKYIQHPIACYILGSHLMYGLNAQELRQIMDSIPQDNRDCRHYRMAQERLDMLQQYESNPSLAEYDRIAAVLRSQPHNINTLIHKAAQMLMGKPYVGGTLDNGAHEQLIASLTEFDCVTFQETCLALAQDAMEGSVSYQNFRQKIEKIRYRNGKNTGWQSRLHYSTDWIISNIEQGNAADLTEKLGGKRMTGAIDFMSRHPQSYKAMVEQPALIDSIKAREVFLNENPTLYIPKAEIDKHASEIPTGSLIFITTSVPGLGYMHVGIALNEGGRLRLMHASSTLMRVTTTEESLQEFLMRIGKATGISVLAPL